MRAYKEWIVMEHLRTRWFVICIVQTNQRVSEERSDLTTRLGDLLTGRRRLDNLQQVGVHLQLSVPIVINSGGPLRTFATAENRTRHLELAKLARERD